MSTEQDRQDAFVAMVGRDGAEKLSRLCRDSYPHGTDYDRLMGSGLTKEQVFERRAKAAGFTLRQIRAYRAL